MSQGTEFSVVLDSNTENFEHAGLKQFQFKSTTLRNKISNRSSNNAAPFSNCQRYLDQKRVCLFKKVQTLSHSLS